MKFEFNSAEDEGEKKMVAFRLSKGARTALGELAKHWKIDNKTEVVERLLLQANAQIGTASIDSIAVRAEIQKIHDLAGHLKVSAEELSRAASKLEGLEGV